MFIVESIAKIRRMYHVDGLAIKAIARELNISKNTVRKIIRSDATEFKMAKYEKDKPVLGDHLELLENLLKENMKEPVRRRMTAKKMFEQLQKKGYNGSYESVNLVVREFRQKHEAKGKQVFIPLSFDAGESFQFDWGEEEILLAGKIVRVKAARIKLCYSGYSLVVVYPNEQLEMVMAAHDEAFRFFEGCTIHGIYDNMKTAIKKILVGKDRELNQKFEQMASHYLFKPIACTPAAGWEKGRVEKQVGDTRRNFFTPILEGDSYAQINSQLKELCITNARIAKHVEFKERTVYEVYLEEKPKLIAYRGPFTAYRLYPTTVSPLSVINYDTNSYSVECSYVGMAVQIKAFAWEIVVLCHGKIIGGHIRYFERYQHIYNPWHYVPALERKPGALRNGAPFRSLMELLPDVFSQIRNALRAYKDGDKQFVKILLFVMKHGLAKVTQACSQAIASGGCNATLVEKYLQVLPERQLQQTEFYQIKNPPNADCSEYSRIYLKGDKA